MDHILMMFNDCLMMILCNALMMLNGSINEYIYPYFMV